MDRDQERQDGRQHGDVKHVEAEQGFLADGGIAQQEELDVLADDRGVAGDRGAHRDRPEGQLVPRQQVAGEAEEEGEQEQHDSQHPVELARLLVGAGEEHAAHVQEDNSDHAMGRPAVHVPQEGAEGDGAAQVQHAVVGLGGGGHVVEHQQDAGGDQHHEQEERHQAETQRVEGTQRVAVHLDGMNVEEEVGEAG